MDIAGLHTRSMVLEASIENGERAAGEVFSFIIAFGPASILKLNTLSKSRKVATTAICYTVQI